MENSKIKNVCVLDFAFQHIAGKYKGRILLMLHRQGCIRYGEFTRIIPDISTKMLTQSLKELERDGLILRCEYPQVPPRVEYSITAEGESFIPFLEHLVAWGHRKMNSPTFSL